MTVRRNHLIDEYACFWGVVVGSLALTHDICRRLAAGTLWLALALAGWSLVALGLVRGLALLLWQQVHENDRAELAAACARVAEWFSDLRWALAEALEAVRPPAWGFVLAPATAEDRLRWMVLLDSLEQNTHGKRRVA